ncbi:MAG: hypothetical protein V4613_09070 [Bacteroidota bacterium]
MKIENDNIDELMFRLLEGEITGEERNMLLQAIAADKEYSKMWTAWQKTVLNPNEELLVMNTGKLKKHKRSLIVVWRQAAVIALTIGVGLWFYIGRNNHQQNFTETVKPGQPKHRIITVPQPSQSANQIESFDTVLPLKQRIEQMAEVKNPKKAPQQILKIETPETSRQQEVPELIVKEETHKKTETPILIKEDKVVTPIQANPVSDGVFASVVSESKMKSNKNNINSIISEKRTLLSRVFSKPKFKVIIDSTSITNKKLIIENQQYKIMAGF